MSIHIAGKAMKYPGGRNILFLFLLMGLFACSSQKELVKKDVVLLNEGNREFAKNDFLQAEEAYKKILDNFPESPYRVNALMGYADTLFRQGNFMEAAWSYRDFYELYPVHEDTEKAYFYSGTSHLFEMGTPERDQTPTRKALEEYQKIVHAPEGIQSPFYAEAKKKIKICTEQLAKQMFSIGKFYFKTRKYLSALMRLKELMEVYPGLSYENEVVYMIAESYFVKDNFTEAEKFFKHLLDQYPADSFTELAKSRLAAISAAGDRLSWN
ncbi:MAG: outer membrane protein assembly factor BamD [Nitrospinota bacterium]